MSIDRKNLKDDRKNLAAMQVGQVALSRQLGICVTPRHATVRANSQASCEACVFGSAEFSIQRPAGTVCAMLHACCTPFRPDRTSVYFVDAIRLLDTDKKHQSQHTQK